ncbi:MAG: DegV family protein [Anaerolineales bacterium]|nr:DegV family protein [Chloroflexota bacterium]MBL6980288.1 DegV family protein [Anaerolineales bacterium]
MSKVAIVTDSTAYLPPEIIEKFQIRVVPLQLIWGDETFRDGVDIQPSEFYDRLPTASVMPTTSQPSAAEFMTVFEELIAEGKEILAILISSGLSGTVASAVQAQKMLPDAKIEIVDSLTGAMGLGIHVLEAAHAAAEGQSLEACKAFAEAAQKKSSIIFAVDTLEFLHRGGRVGGAKRLVGTMLNIKPILEVQEGKVEALDSVRTRKKAHARLLELIQERSQGAGLRYASAMHANAPEDAQRLLDRLGERMDVGETFLVELSPVIGAHVGPGTVVMAYMFEE